MGTNEQLIVCGVFEHFEVVAGGPVVGLLVDEDFFGKL